MANSLESILSKYKSGRREELIPLLQEIQEEEGMISEEAIIKVGTLLGLSTSKIYGLATFYDQFRFSPTGKIHLRICNGTTCYINGSQSIIKSIKDELGIDPGETTRDGLFSFEVGTCMGGCSNGPIICSNGEYYTHLRPEQMPTLISSLKLTIET
jgi:NADH:ubiquinone oxidoreductase subunit E